jgi:hypothetical protein
MNSFLIVGTSIVNLALISYSLFIYQELKYKIVSKKLLSFLTTGILLDIIATICMVTGSSKGAFTIHGIIGYSSLLAMLIDTILLWKLKNNKGVGSTITPKLHAYSVFAYTWWIVAYITGALIVMMR